MGRGALENTEELHSPSWKKSAHDGIHVRLMT